VFERVRKAILNLLLPTQPAHKRMYNMARASRLTGSWGNQTTSEDTETITSLRTARNRSRALIRDSAYALRAKVVVQTNVVGAGIGLQARVTSTRGTMNDRINKEIEEQWGHWAAKDSCHTGQSLCFEDFERQVMGQVFEAGECFVRWYPQRFGSSKIPFALELIEAERIADELSATPGFYNTVKARMGVELNEFGAPISYLIHNRHPGDIQPLTLAAPFKIEQVPAYQILHIRVIDRWPQTRAMPWLHAAARKLNDMDGLTEAEITAARAAACYMGFIELPNAMQKYGEEQADGSFQSELEPAIIERLNPGEKFTFAAPNRPNAQLDPFMRMMLREVAAGAGCSYEGLSRDYSQSNYSSSRLALIDDRDLWRTLQKWLIRELRYPIHNLWLQQAVLSGALPSINMTEYGANPQKFQSVRFKARGWSWVDPTKEVDAYREAVRSGFMTVGDVIGLTGEGRTLEDVLDERRIELDLMAEKKLVFDTDPATVLIPPKPTAVNQPSTEPTDTNTPARDRQIDKMLGELERELEGA
jgi:lambda family phage portal protein